MSKITFRHRAKDENSEKIIGIKIRLIISRENILEVDSGYTVKPKDWNKTTGFPKRTNTTENKVLENKLKILETQVLDDLFKEINITEKIDKAWLQSKVDKHWGKTSTKESKQVVSDILKEHIKKYIELAPIKNIKGRSSLGLSANTIRTYNTFLNLITIYEDDYLKKPILFSEINKSFVDRFINWLLTEKKYSKNYAGKQLDHIKTICTDAIDDGIKVNDYFKKIQSFKEENEDRYIVTFSFEEIEKIRKTPMPSSSLENAKKWMLIGFEIGQRVSDLLKLDKSKITQKDENGFLFLNIFQQKTRKEVTVAVMNPNTIDFMENDFPHPISSQKLNEYIKDVCEIAGITEIIEGTKYDSVTKRKKFGKFPKNQLFTTHSFRRSFATNWYQKMETSIIMEITGHSKEAQFREYINVRADKEICARNFAENAKKIFEQMEQEKPKEVA